MFKYNNYDGKYFSKSSCKFLLQYHLIFVCKYRKRLLIGKIKDFMKESIISISKKYDFEIKHLECDEDHIHFLINSTPQISISQIVRVLKQESTVFIWKHFNAFLKQHFWKEYTFWTDGYFVSSIGEVSQYILMHYIENQGKSTNSYHPLEDE